MKISAAILIFASVITAQWDDVSIQLEDSYLGWAFDAIDENIAAISYDVIYITTDGGSTWNKKTFPENESAVDLEILDADNLVACTADGKIYSSSDGGSSWVKVYNDIGKTEFMNYVEFFDADNGVAMGDALNSSQFNSVCFTNENIGWIAGKSFGWNVAGIILHTKNGGENWSPQNINTTTTLNSVFALNDNQVWAMGEADTLFYSSDGGESWNKKSLNLLYNSNQFVFFLTKNVGFIGGNKLYKTTDGGNTWTEILNSENLRFTALEFTDDSTAFLIDNNLVNKTSNILWKTENQGLTWTKSLSGDVTCLDFISETSGMAAGNKVFRTTDTGESWTELIPDRNYCFIDIHAASENQVYLLTSDNILFTSNFGDTWQEIRTTADRKLSKVYFSGPTTGWLIGNGCLLLKCDENILNISEVEKDTLPTAIILHTNNGGKNWIESDKNNLTEVSSADIWRRIDFVDDQTGYLHCYVNNSGLYKTMDGGVN